MITLTRRPNQTIQIRTADGTEIVVQVLDLRDEKVRLGIACPPSARVIRGELAPVIEGWHLDLGGEG